MPYFSDPPATSFVTQDWWAAKAWYSVSVVCRNPRQTILRQFGLKFHKEIILHRKHRLIAIIFALYRNLRVVMHKTHQVQGAARRPITLQSHPTPQVKSEGRDIGFALCLVHGLHRFQRLATERVIILAGTVLGVARAASLMSHGKSSFPPDTICPFFPCQRCSPTNSAHHTPQAPNPLARLGCENATAYNRLHPALRGKPP